MSHTAFLTPSSSVTFPDATAGQTATRTLHVHGAIQPTDETSSVTLPVTFNGHTVNASASVTKQATTVQPEDITADVQPPEAQVEVSVGPWQAVAGYEDRWTAQVTFTTT